MSARPKPVTAAVSRRVVRGREREFEQWAHDISSAAAEFPGYLGSGYIRPASIGGEHTIIYRFDTAEHFSGWQDSPDRAEWVERSRHFVEGEPHVETATGLEYWFHDPGCSSSSPPPVWKQALLTWVGLYPTVLLVAYTVGALTAAWALPVRSVVTTALSVLLMTWVVMPVVTRFSRPFLRPEATRA